MHHFRYTLYFLKSLFRTLTFIIIDAYTGVCEADTTIYEFQKSTKNSDRIFYSSTVPDKN